MDPQRVGGRIPVPANAGASFGDSAGVLYGGRAACPPVRHSDRRYAEAEKCVTFDLSFPTDVGQVHPLQLDVGETLFVLGANGTGKSSLMFRFNTQNHGHARKVSAQRQIWMQSDTRDLIPSNKLQTEQTIRNQDQNDQSRHRDPYAAARASIAVFELVDAENRRARAMARAYDDKWMDDLASEAEAEAPIAVINELFRESRIPIEISIRDNEQVTASKNGGPEYGTAQLSDGERNVLQISASLNKTLVQDLARGDCIGRHENAILLGSSGVGKITSLWPSASPPARGVSPCASPPPPSWSTR